MAETRGQLSLALFGMLGLEANPLSEGIEGVPVDLSTVVAAPTTCSLTTCLTTCKVYLLGTNSCVWSVPVRYWKSPQNHTSLWK